MEGIDIITQYILAIVPAFTAVVGMVVTLGVGIGKIKKANQSTMDSIDNISKKSNSLESKLRDVSTENIELKRQLRKVMSKLEHVHFIDKE